MPRHDAREILEMCAAVLAHARDAMEDNGLPRRERDRRRRPVEGLGQREVDVLLRGVQDRSGRRAQGRVAARMR